MRSSRNTSATGSARRESVPKKTERGKRILKILKKEFSNPRTALSHENAFQLLIATILSAQCTDERVNQVTQTLFRKYRSPQAFAAASPAELEQDIRPTGFFHMKTKNIIACSQSLVEKHGGNVPQKMEELVTLPGVGRKTANVVLGQAYGITAGVVVDTHVHRVSQRLGITESDTPEKIELDLMALFPKRDWIDLGTVLILHGRRTCKAKRPLCPQCSLNDLCPSANQFLKRGGK